MGAAFLFVGDVGLCLSAGNAMGRLATKCEFHNADENIAAKETPNVGSAGKYDFQMRNFE